MSATTEPKRRRKRRPGWAMKPGTDELKVWMTQEDRLATFWLMRQLNQPSPQALVKHLVAKPVHLLGITLGKVAVVQRAADDLGHVQPGLAAAECVTWITSRSGCAVTPNF